MKYPLPLASILICTLVSGCLTDFMESKPPYTPYLSLNYNNRGKSLALTMGEEFRGKVSKVTVTFASGDSLEIDSIYHCPRSKFCFTDLVDSTRAFDSIAAVRLRYAYGGMEYDDSVDFGSILAYYHSIRLSRTNLGDSLYAYSAKWDNGYLKPCDRCYKIIQIDIGNGMYLANNVDFRSSSREDPYVVEWGRYSLDDGAFTSGYADTSNFDFDATTEIRNRGSHKLKVYLGKFMFDFDGAELP